MKIEDRIQELRKSKGLSQEQLAETLGISRQAVSKWESGQSLPEIDKLVAMSELFDVTVDYILKGNSSDEDKKNIDDNEGEIKMNDEKKTSLNDRETSKQRRSSIFALWPLFVLIYLAVSFLTKRWDITWLIFLLPAAIQSVYLFFTNFK